MSMSKLLDYPTSGLGRKLCRELVKDTLREHGQLKNKDTGIDLAVTSVKEVKALIGSGFEYEVMVVSNLACFKTAKHKETDNVQFTVQRKFSEFEDLHTKLNTKYTGTAFPQLPKKVIKVSAVVAKERRQDLDKFLKYLAMTDKLSSCPLLLEFLGVNSLKASNFRKPEPTQLDASQTEKTEEDANEKETVKQSSEEGLFEEGDEEVDDDDDYNDDDIFADKPDNTDRAGGDNTKIFGDQDLGRAIDDEDDSDLFVPDARSEVRGQSQVVKPPEEQGNEDLLNIEDDLEELVKLSTKPRQTTDVKDQTENKKSSAKPTLSKKPTIPIKKPELTKNNSETSKTAHEESEVVKVIKQKPPSHQKPKIADKPSLAQKPDLKPKPKSGSSEKVNPLQHRETETNVPNLSEDDILKYIQENNANNNDDLDLFS